MIRIIAWGTKHGPAPRNDLLIDAKVLPNPYSVTILKDKSGLHEQVKLFVELGKSWATLVNSAWLGLCKLHATKNDSVIVVACMGGRHRSVVVAKYLADRAAYRGIEVKLELPYVS